MSKKIGLLMSLHHTGVLTGIKYIQFASQFGDVEFINPYLDEVKNVDLLILPGGADVNPERYDCKPHALCQPSNLSLEWFDKNVLPKYIDANIPIFGICRGMQTLAVHFGAKMKQHMSLPTSGDNRGTLVDKLVFFDNKGREVHKKYEVNSLHHQFVYDSLNIEVLARDVKTWAMEAMRIVDKNIYGVQWHPEEMEYCAFTTNIIQLILYPNVFKS